jgi:hypothetical protein
MSAAITLEELAFWREMIAQARAAVERPTLENAAKLRRLGERARTVRAPGFKIPGRLQLFHAFNVAARSGDAAQLPALADQVEAAIAAASPYPPLRERKDFA